MEISDGKQAENGLKRPKRSKNEAKKRSSVVWDQENSQVLPKKPEPLFVSRYESAVITGVIQANAENAGKDINPWLSGLMANYHHSTGFLWQLDHLSKLGENDMKYSDIFRKITGIVFFHGFTKTINKRVFLKDCGFFGIITEIQPFRNYGVFINIGVKFFWSDYYNVNYDYSRDNIRISEKTSISPLGALMFDSPTFNIELEQTTVLLEQKIDEYSRLVFVEEFCQMIYERRDFVAVANPDFKNKDVSLAIVNMILGRSEMAFAILKNGSIDNHIASQLLDHTNDIADFIRVLTIIINNCRLNLAKNLGVVLEPINALWSDYKVN